MRASGALRDFSRHLDPASLGRSLTAFVSVSLSQATGQRAIDALRGIPEVIEIHAVTGDSDLLAKVVARDSADFHRIAGTLLAMPDIVRFSTAISTKEEMPSVSGHCSKTTHHLAWERAHPGYAHTDRH